MALFSLLFVIFLNYSLDKSRATIFPGQWEGAQPRKPYQTDWIAWKQFYNKTYHTKEEQSRLSVWLRNFYANMDHSLRWGEGKEFYVKGMNKFSDHSPLELRRKLRAEVPLTSYYERTQPVKLPAQDVPDNVNWGLHGSKLVQNFHDVSLFGWASSAVEAIQAQLFWQTGYRINPSMKEIVDCSKSMGQRFISMDAFSYIKENGVTFNTRYSRLHQRRMPCRRKENRPKIFIGDFHLLEPENEENLKIAVATIGPISVNIRVTGNFFFYKSGVFYDPECAYSEPVTNHAVLVVGYGSDPVGGDFWIIQNNWGKHWGETGFGRMSRNSLINCGIAAAAFFAEGVTIDKN